MHADLNPQPLPPRATRVYASHEVLYDLDKFQSALKSILDRAGHNNCTSGLQLDWIQFEQFYIDDKLDARPVLDQRSIGFGG
ncbi:hypothetical protein ACK8HX_03180 [Oryzobacter sp. R7]|uniref:hypothetical protein n=1 Tax=Oryzobacter faecalis TaxID=3388656 RepID=UPI00398D48DF